MKILFKQSIVASSITRAFTVAEKTGESELLPKLGLNNENIDEFPEELYHFCGSGLFSWQYPNQFSKYLVFLSKFKIDTYLEIGVRRGGTFIITIEYLNRFHTIRYALGVDIVYSQYIREYQTINPNVNYMIVDSQSPAFKECIAGHNTFDLVLIDGDHSESACRYDFETVKDRFNMCAFHDIGSDVCLGVGKVWEKLKLTHSDKYRFIEFVDQYESVKMRTRKKYLGIGIAIKNDFYENTMPPLVNYPFRLEKGFYHIVHQTGSPKAGPIKRKNSSAKIFI